MSRVLFPVNQLKQLEFSTGVADPLQMKKKMGAIKM